MYLTDAPNDAGTCKAVSRAGPVVHDRLRRHALASSLCLYRTLVQMA